MKSLKLKVNKGIIAIPFEKIDSFSPFINYTIVNLKDGSKINAKNLYDRHRKNIPSIRSQISAILELQITTFGEWN